MTEFSKPQICNFLAILFKSNLYKSHARRKIDVFESKLVLFPKIETFHIFNLLRIIVQVRAFIWEYINLSQNTQWVPTLKKI